ncbi:MAG TPA: hypothetical protein VN282_02310 [Pyrinomonadaceae bacterium]|nr:hypothetical protein [Pyrinomonadaceae bacterium]
MSHVTTISELKEEHDSLFSEAFARRSTFIANQKHDRKYIKSFKERANKLLESLTALSGQVTSVDEYNLLSEMASQWQAVYSTILNEPLDIKIQPPSLNLRKDTPLSEEELRKRHLARAGELSIIRWINHVLQQARTDIKKVPSTAEQMASDWHNAQIEFASRVLDGEIAFIHQLSLDSYWRLEDVWLREVKRYRAYRFWENRGSVLWNPEADYLKACAQLLDKLVDDGIKKSSPTEFEKARTYLMRYLNKDGKLDPVKAEDMLKRRAYQIWESGGGGDEKVNHEIAETYLKLFYENIIPAVTRNDAESTLLVLKALQYSRALGGRYIFVNCFEAALAIYFLDPRIIKRLWAKAEKCERPRSLLVSEVPIDFWPTYLPREGRHRLRHENGRLTFEGVMTRRERAELMKGLTSTVHRKAVRRLYHLSRYLPRDLTL